MAKRYARLNWQNSPSVATPINATNLNKMDKGIDDCDDAIEVIYSKRVNNVVTTNEDTFLAGPVGKYLQDQITATNNNLAHQYLEFFSSPSITFNEFLTELCAYINSNYSNIYGGHCYVRAIRTGDTIYSGIFTACTPNYYTLLLVRDNGTDVYLINRSNSSYTYKTITTSAANTF